MNSSLYRELLTLLRITPKADKPVSYQEGWAIIERVRNRLLPAFSYALGALPNDDILTRLQQWRSGMPESWYGNAEIDDAITAISHLRSVGNFVTPAEKLPAEGDVVIVMLANNEGTIAEGAYIGKKFVVATDRQHTFHLEHANVAAWSPKPVLRRVQA